MSAVEDRLGDRGRARQAAVLVIGKMFAVVSEAAVPLLIVRLLGKVEVGLLFAVLLIYSTIALVVTAGFPATLMYYMPTRAPGERRAVAERVAVTMLGMGAVAALVLLLVAGVARWAPGLAQSAGAQGGGLGLLALLAAYPLGDVPARMLPNLLVVEERARAAAAFGAFRAIGTACAVLIPLSLGAELDAVVVSLSAFGLVQGAVVIFCLRVLYPKTPRQPTDLGIRDLFKFAIPIGMTDIVGKLSSTLDRYLILAVFPMAAFAEYQAGAWQIPIVTAIPFAVGTVFTPHFTRLINAGQGRAAVDTWRRSIEKVSLIVIPCTAIFVVGAEEAMELLFTAEYAGAAGVFRCYSLLTLGRVAAFGAMIVAAGRPGFVLKAALLSLAANVVISVPALLLFGFEGPAIGTALAFIPTAAFYCWGIGRATGVPIAEVFPLVGYGKVLLTAAAACTGAVAFKIQFSWSPGAMLATEAAIVLVVFCLLGSITGLIRRSDWRFFSNWIGGRAASAR